MHVLQIYGEIQERQHFIETMQAMGKTGDTVNSVKLEIAVRLKELEGLGVDIHHGRRNMAAGQSDPNSIVSRMSKAKLCS